MDVLNELSEKNGDKEAGTNLKRKATGAVEVDDVPKRPNTGSDVRENSQLSSSGYSKYIQPEYGSNNQDASTSLRDEPEVMIIDDGLTTNMHIGQRFVNRVLRHLESSATVRGRAAHNDKISTSNINSNDNVSTNNGNCGLKIVQEGPSATVNTSTTVVKNRSVKELCDALGITHLPSSMHVMNLIQEKVQKFAAEFSEFEQHIWTHYSSNAQIAFAALTEKYTESNWRQLPNYYFIYVKGEEFGGIFFLVYPGANMFAVGSTVNGCGAYNSDMDLCLCLPHPALGYDTDRQYAIPYHLSVPILKLEMGGPYSELEIDINCNNVAGIYNSHLLHYYSRIDDCFPALCLVVKHWAIIANINDAMSGTLNRLVLPFNDFAAIVVNMCCTMPPVLPNLQELNPDIFNAPRGVEQLELFRDVPQLPQRPLNHASVGELLIAFFDYYSKFDFDTKAISVARGCVFDRSELAAETKRYKIFIEEPFDHQNTARCVTRVERLRAIKTAFISARNAFLGPTSGPPKLANIGVH
ncbi:unnamed protein product [Anisakis simplex]|uniref:Poly(A) RNA polymerase GLD2 (inferred by orthology to a human protein) n=1 Tax=Anisakis simplex TaxID=6269 RepID=A0A158PNM6_ANISI|nr:unnamed protein product [Anisakis simplex]